MPDTMQSKLSKTRAGERTRLWLQGSRLPDHGFPHGSKFRKRIEPGRIVITPLDSEQFAHVPRAERGSIAGDPARPVIDITGQIVADTFKGDHVNVRYTKNRIEITEA